MDTRASKVLGVIILEALVDSPLLTLFLLVLLGGGCLYPFIRASRKPERIDLFEPIFLSSAYFFLLFVLRGFYTLFKGSQFITLPIEPILQRCFNLALIYLLPSLGCFYLGYFGPWGGRVAATLPNLGTAWSVPRLRNLGPLVVLLGVGFHIALIQMLGGFNTYMNTKSETLTASGTAYLYMGTHLLPLLLAVVTTQWASGKKGYLVNFTVLVPILLFVSAISGSKGVFFNPILMVIIVYNYLKNPVRPVYFLSFVLSVIVLMPFFNIYRQAPDVRLIWDYTIEGLVTRDPIEFAMYQVMTRFYGIDSLILIIKDTPGVMSFQYGATVAPFFVSWIPRQLWEGKPVISFGKVFGETYMSDHFAGTGTAASPTILGEGYVNFHLPGMLIVAFLLGLMLRIIYIWLIRRNKGGPGVFAYAALFMFLVLAWENVIAALLSFLLAYAGLIFGMVYLFRSRSCTTTVVPGRVVP